MREREREPGTYIPFVVGLIFQEFLEIVFSLYNFAIDDVNKCKFSIFL